MDFEYGKERETREFNWIQEITFNGVPVGFLVSRMKNLFVPTEKIYLIPDIEYGIQDGFGDFKRFTEHDEALDYVKDNFNDVSYIFENGDFD